ncbi:adenylate/guanylate cyclase domain-containing protein [Nitrosopumilus sp. S4]
MKVQDYMVAFSGQTKSYCVGIVDMVDSTKISSKLSIAKTSKYYEIFLNTMARVLNRFGGMIIKNIGDSLLFYFPESSKGRKYGFMTCLEGCLAMIDSHDFVCMCATRENLPPINYRISCDYGQIMMMSNNGSNSPDMVGPPLNICSKINHFAFSNELVIGGDLYEMVKKLSDYAFSLAGSYDTELKFSYPVYKTTRR